MICKETNEHDVMTIQFYARFKHNKAASSISEEIAGISQCRECISNLGK